PSAFGRKTPVVEVERQFQLRGGPAPARAASGNMQLVGRVGEPSLEIVQIQRAILRFGSLEASLECGTTKRPCQASFPMEMAADHLRLRVGSTQPVDEIVPQGEVFGVNRQVDRSIDRAESAAKLNAAGGSCNLAR